MNRRRPMRSGWGCPLLVSGLLALILTGCHAGSPPAAGSPGETAPPAESAAPAVEAPITVAVAGDSNSTGVTGTLEAGVHAHRAWVALLPEPGFDWVGGWARDGATSIVIAEHIQPLPDAQVLVILAGTNDLAQGIPADQSMAAIARIADVVQAERTVVAAIPPFDGLAAEAAGFNARLEAEAAARRWWFVDPWRELRSPQGTWLPPYATDGVHTTPDGYAQMAQALAEQLPTVVGSAAAQ